MPREFGNAELLPDRTPGSVSSTAGWDTFPRVLSEPTLASDALRAHKQYDANRSSTIYSLTIKRNFFSSSTLHFRFDAADRDVWWQLRDAPASWEYARRGWFVVPVLTVPDFDAYLQQKVLALNGILQENDTPGDVIRHRGSHI